MATPPRPRQGLARDLAELQARLDEFVLYYNEERPHQGIGRVTPLSRWHASAPATAGQPPAHPALRTAPQQVTIQADGMIRLRGLTIGVGVEWARCAATLITDDNYATVFYGDQLVRHLRLDHTRHYQPTGRPPGGPRRPRHLTS